MIIIDIIIILYFYFVLQNSNPKIYCPPKRNSTVSSFLFLPSLTQPLSTTCALSPLFCVWKVKTDTQVDTQLYNLLAT